MRKKLSIFLSSLLLLVGLTYSTPVHSRAIYLDLIGSLCDLAKAGTLVPITTDGARAVFDTIAGDRVWYDQSFCQFRQKVFNPGNPTDIYGERYTYAQVSWITSSLMAWMFQAVNNLLSIASDLIVQVPNNNYVGVNNMSFTRSFAQYVSKFNPVGVAHAQNGFGYSTLNGIQFLWSASANMALLMVVIALVVLGFMVMFRVKLNPQTAVTVQTVIPRLIVTLIAIIFSYAIAGLIIDLVNFAIYFVFTLLPNQFFADAGNKAQTIRFFTESNFIGITSYFSGRLAPIMTILMFFMGPVGFIIPIIFIVLIGRVYWVLLQAYIRFILQVLVGPWQILLGLFPNQPGLKGWFKRTLAQGSSFIVTPLMLALAIFILNMGGIAPGLQSLLDSTFGSVVGLNPNISSSAQITALPALPLVNGGSGLAAWIFSNIVGMGILALIPSTVRQVQEAIGGREQDFGTAIGEALGMVGASYGFARARTANLVPQGPWGLMAINAIRNRRQNAAPTMSDNTSTKTSQGR